MSTDEYLLGTGLREGEHRETWFLELGLVYPDFAGKGRQAGLAMDEALRVATVGLEGVIVVEDKDSVLVASKERSEDVKALVERLKEQVSAMLKADRDVEAMAQKVEQLQAKNDELQKEADDSRLMVQSVRAASEAGGQGMDLPPCWPRADVGSGRVRAEYIFDITIAEDGFEVEPGWPESRTMEVANLQADALLGRVGTPSEFRDRFAEIRLWSDLNHCRLSVRIRDETTSKAAFKGRLLAAEEVFYKYLIRDESGT